MLQYRSIAFKLKTNYIMMTSLTKLTKNETADCVSCYPYVLVGPQDMDFSVEGRREGGKEGEKEGRRREGDSNKVSEWCVKELLIGGNCVYKVFIIV